MGSDVRVARLLSKDAFSDVLLALEVDRKDEGLVWLGCGSNGLVLELWGWAGSVLCKRPLVWLSSVGRETSCFE